MAKEAFVIRLQGAVTTGKGEAGRFTSLGWVQEQLRLKMRIVPYPGTLNLRIVPQDLLKLVGLKMLDWVSIESEDRAFCAARSYPVKMGKKVYGAIILPDIKDYPADQIEIVSAKSIRTELGLADGDIVEIEALAAIPGA
jgi:CTP-dependent riboflavin kinase